MPQVGVRRHPCVHVAACTVLNIRHGNTSPRAGVGRYGDNLLRITGMILCEISHNLAAHYIAICLVLIVSRLVRSLQALDFGTAPFVGVPVLRCAPLWRTVAYSPSQWGVQCALQCFASPHTVTSTVLRQSQYSVTYSHAYSLAPAFDDTLPDNPPGKSRAPMRPVAVASDDWRNVQPC